MITKKTLVDNRERTNTALLRLKQSYSKHNNRVFLIVEGNDDQAFYKCIIVKYIQHQNYEIIIANSRYNVTNTYRSLDWRCFDRHRVLFFVDRDLSEMTGEYTPNAENVYITDGYSIENSLFNEEILH
jgi:hypothetical protein